MDAAEVAALFQEEEFPIADAPAPVGEMAALDAPVAEGESETKPRFSRDMLLVIGLSILLVLEWMAFGWLFWTTQFGGMTPAQQTQARERMFRISLASERYWRSGDVAQVQRDLGDIPRSELTRMMSEMLRETTDPGARLHLTAVATLMQVESTEATLAGALLSQSGILFGLLVATVPLLAAIVVVALPTIRRRTRIPGLALSPAELAQEAAAEEGGGEILEELVADVPAEPNLEVNAENKPEEAPATEEESQEADAGLGDLASLFEEEDTSLAALESFCKGMADVNVDDLLKKSREMTQKFKTHRYKAP